MKLRKLIVAAGIITAMSIAMGTSVFAYTLYKPNAYMDANGNIIVHYYGTDGQLIKNQWILEYAPPKNPSAELAAAIAASGTDSHLNESWWLYIGDDGMRLGENAITPDGYTLGQYGYYYCATTEADMDANEAQTEYLRTGSSVTTTTASTTTNNTTSTTTTQTATAGSYMDIGTEEFNNELIDLINDYRAANGLKRLKKTSDAMSAAETRALELTYSYNRWHLRPDERVSSSVWDDLGYEITETRTAAENCEIIHKGDTPKSAFEIWKNSSGHNKNMLNSRISEIGIGSCVDPDRDDVYVSMNCK